MKSPTLVLRRDLWLLTLLGLAATQPCATAQTTWTAGTDATWSTPTNWSTGEPTLGTAAIFPTPIPVGGGTITLSAGEQAQSLAFNSDGYLLTGGTLELASPGNVTVTTSGHIAQIDSVLNGTNGLTKLGAGTLTLGGANTFTGATTVLSGTLTIASGGSIGVASATAGSLKIGESTTASLIVQSGGNLKVGSGSSDSLLVGARTTLSGTTIGTLDMSAAATFTADVGLFQVGGSTSTSQASTSTTAVGNVTLAENNSITASAGIIVAKMDPAVGNTGVTSTIQFGAGTNDVITPSFLIGGSRSTGSVTIATDGILNLDNGAGKTNLTIGQNRVAGTNTAAVGTMNLTAGTLVADLDQLILGDKGSANGLGAGTATGTLTLGTGANDVTANSVILGNQVDGDSGATTTTQGTLNMAGGTFTVAGDVGLGIFIQGSNSRGTLNLTGGTFTVNGNITSTNDAKSTAILTLNGGTLDMTGGSIDANTFTASAGTLNDVSEIFNGDGATAADLTKTTSGILTLSGTNTYTGRTLINSGTVIVDSEDNLGANPVALTADQLTLNGGTLNSAATFAIDDANRGITLGAGGGTFNTDSSTTLTAGTIMAGAGNLTKSGGGNLILTNNANSFSGQITISSGELSISDVGQLGSGTSAIRFTGGGLRITENVTSARDLTFTTTSSGTNTFRIEPDKTAEFTGTLSGNGFLRVDTGTAVLTKYPTQILILSGSGSNGTGGIWLSSNSVLSLRGTTTLGTGNLGIQGTSVLDLTDNVGNMTRSLGTGAGEIQMTTGFGGGFSASGSNKIVALGGIGTETDLAWGVTGSFFNTAAQHLVFGSSIADATVDFRNALDINPSATGGLTRNFFSINGVSPGTKEGVFSGLITKSGVGSTTLAFIGNGEIELTNGFNGSTGNAWTTIVKGGTLLLGANATSGAGNTVLSDASGAIQIGDTAALDANGVNGAAALLTNGVFDVSRDIQVNSGNVSTATFGGNADATTTWSGNVILNKNAQLTSASTGANKVIISGAVSGSGGLIKIGTGIADLSRAAGNSYLGGTTVMSGTLLANNTSGSATGSGDVAVDGGTLGGGGIISGAVQVNSGGTLAPGNSAGLLTTGDLAFTSGSHFSLELNSTTPASGYDQVSVNGVVTLTGGDIQLTLGFTPTITTDVFYVILNDGFEPVNGTFAGLAEGALISAGGSHFQITYLANWTGTQGGSATTGGNDVALITAVPEPGSLASLAFGLGSLLGLGRFRRRRS